MVYIKRKLTKIESTERTTSVKSAGSVLDEGDDDAFLYSTKEAIIFFSDIDLP
jgi:hypothetical protein